MPRQSFGDAQGAGEEEETPSFTKDLSTLVSSIQSGDATSTQSSADAVLKDIASVIQGGGAIGAQGTGGPDGSHGAHRHHHHHGGASSAEATTSTTATGDTSALSASDQPSSTGGSDPLQMFLQESGGRTRCIGSAQRCSDDGVANVRECAR